jgi:LysR family glycine cleavage system transcriptional activator
LSFRLPPIGAIRAFEAAARHQNFTRAADELGMTQATVSYQIKMLEERLGSALFVREPRRVRLTAVGRRLAPAVTEAFVALKSAFAEARGDADRILSISVTPTFAAAWLIPRLPAFQSANPAVTVRLDVTFPPSDTSDEQFSVGIRGGRGEWPGLISHLLFSVRMLPVCSPGLLKKSRVSHPSDLLKLPLLGQVDLWRLWAKAAGLKDFSFPAQPDNILGTQHFEELAAISGQGVALVTPSFFTADLASGRIVIPFDIALEDGRGYWLVYPAAHKREQKVVAFRDWILDQVKSNRP